MNKMESGSRPAAIVFGGSRGIGAAIVRRLAQDGMDVALTFVSSEQQANEVATQARALGVRAIAICADSADPGAIGAAVAQTAAEFGRLDVAVVNAGILRLGDVSSVTLDALDEMLDVNVRGVFLAIQAAAERLIEGGRIVTIGSNTAVRNGHPGSSVYSMTKAAVATMVKGIAIDLAPRGITVNNVQPGPTLTDMSAPFADALPAHIPLRRIGQPEEVAALVSYLTSAESGYMTGSSLTIDGGMTL